MKEDMMTLKNALLGALAVSIGGYAVGCDGGAGTGSVAVGITGEEAATNGLPFSEDGETIAFSDGDWTVTFSKYIVSFSNITIGDDASLAGPFIADISKAAGDPPTVEVGTVDGLEAGRHPFGFEIVAATEGATKLGDVADADITAMKDAGASYRIAGHASDGTDDVDFDWLFPGLTKNADCTNGVDDTQGIVVEPNATADAEITIHIEHIFYDTLGVEGPDLVFDPIAAAARITHEATVLRDVKAPYPKALADRGVEGAVVLLVDVTKTGSTRDARVVKSSGEPDLDKLALDAVKRFTWRPAEQGSASVDSRVRYTYRFELYD